MDLDMEIRAALNRWSAENASNTPDFILSEYLLACLDAFNRTTQRREQWYGRSTDHPSAPPIPDGPEPT